MRNLYLVFLGIWLSFIMRLFLIRNTYWHSGTKKLRIYSAFLSFLSHLYSFFFEFLFFWLDSSSTSIIIQWFIFMFIIAYIALFFLILKPTLFKTKTVIFKSCLTRSLTVLLLIITTFTFLFSLLSNKLQAIH
jgi:hypothetical protein